MAIENDRQIMLNYVTNQLKDTIGVTEEILNEMKWVRLETYDISPEDIERTLGHIKPGDKRFYCLVEIIKKLIDPELKITVETVRIIEMLSFWESELEEFLDDHDLIDYTTNEKLIKVTSNKIKIDNRKVPYYYLVEEGTSEDL